MFINFICNSKILKTHSKGDIFYITCTKVKCRTMCFQESAAALIGYNMPTHCVLVIDVINEIVTFYSENYFILVYAYNS